VPAFLPSSVRTTSCVGGLPCLPGFGDLPFGAEPARGSAATWAAPPPRRRPLTSIATERIARNTKKYSRARNAYLQTASTNGVRVSVPTRSCPPELEHGVPDRDAVAGGELPLAGDLMLVDARAVRRPEVAEQVPRGALGSDLGMVPRRAGVVHHDVG